MAIIAYWSNSRKETGQTLSIIATSVMMAINHNYKSLLISTGFLDKAVEESFWTEIKGIDIKLSSGVQVNNSSMESGIEGVATIIQSNRISKGIIGNYARVVFKDRLDVLTAPKTDSFEDYVTITQNYPNIVKIAKEDYNMVFVDVDKRLPENVQREILQNADIIMINAGQRQKDLDEITELRKNDELFSGRKVMIMIGRYDRFSKYNMSNVTRYLKEKKNISTIPYNTLLFEASEEGKIVDYFLRYRNLTDKTDNNFVLMEAAKKTCENLIYKIQELKMRR